MSSKINPSYEARVKFNGEGVSDFDLFAEKLQQEAAKRGCENHFQWKEDEINTHGNVPEEVFLFTRKCAIGEEDDYAEQVKEAKIETLKETFETQLARLTELYKKDELKYKKADLETKLENDINVIENGFEDAVDKVKAACDLFDKKEKLFKETLAGAINLLNTWLGPNPRNRIWVTLRDHGPKNAWKQLVDGYNDESQTSEYLNNVTTKMSRLQFSKDLGKVGDHMAWLDRQNEALVRRGRPISDGELLRYLIDAIKRDKDATEMFKDEIKHMYMDNLDRAASMALLIRTENSAAQDAEMNGRRTNSAGAKFAKVQGAFAGTAVSQKSGTKRKREGGGV